MCQTLWWTDRTTPFGNNFENSECEEKHHQSDDDIHVPGHLRIQRDRLSKKPDQPSKNKIRNKTPNIELQEWSESLPRCFGLMELIMFRGKREEESPSYRKTTACPRHQTNKKNPTHRQCTGGRRR